MLPVLATPDVPLHSIAPRECYDKNGYSKTKAFLYKVAYTPSFFLSSNEQSLRTAHIVQWVFAGISLLIIISRPPCSTYLKKLAPLISKIIPLKWVENVFKCAIGIPMAIMFFATASVYMLLMQKKCRIVLGTIIAVKILAALYLHMSKPTAEKHAAHLQKIVNATAPTKSAKEFFEIVSKIREVDETTFHDFTVNCISVFLKKRIALIDPQTDIQTYVEKIRDILAYVTTKLQIDSLYLTPELRFFRIGAAKHIYAYTKDLILTLSVLKTTETADVDLAGPQYLTLKHANILGEGALFLRVLFDLAQLQLANCDLEISHRAVHILKCMNTGRDHRYLTPGDIVKIITDYEGHEFIDVLFMHDAVFISQNRLIRTRIPKDPSFNKSVDAFSKFLTEKCSFANPKELHISIDKETKPVDWSEDILKERIKVLNATVLGP